LSLEQQMKRRDLSRCSAARRQVGRWQGGRQQSGSQPFPGGDAAGARRAFPPVGVDLTK